MANQTFLDEVGQGIAPNTWEAACFDALRYSAYNFTIGLVNGFGEDVPNLTNHTWGIKIDTCYQYCNNRAIPSVRMHLYPLALL